MQKNKIFQDSTQGYISVPEIYVSELIDTAEMQRLKDVSQTGLKALYSGATHDRFSHSMGVYNIGCHIYDGFIENIGLMLNNEELKRAQKLLRQWHKLFQIACLLHDIGHPAFSHTLEFLFDSPYVCIDIKNSDKTTCIKIDATEINRFYKRYLKDSPSNLTDINNRYLKGKVIEEIRNKEEAADFKFYHSYNNIEEFKHAQHEMMGAYLILTDKQLQGKIKRSYYDQFKEEYYAFIARMITGIKYDPIIPGKFSFELSLRNCVISLLNGKIDADSIDYLNRNSHFAGYSTSKFDLTRLWDSFSAYYDKKRKVFIPCLKKSALSTLDSFASARNFEPKWLYSHHKIVYYNDFLIKFLVKMCGQYIFAAGQRNWEKAILDNLQENDSELYNDIHGVLIKQLVKAYFSVKIEKKSSYKDWQKFFKENLSDEGNDDSIIKRLLDSKRKSADSVIQEIEPDNAWTSYAHHDLLEFFIGIIKFYSDKIFELYEKNPKDNKQVNDACDEFKQIINFIRKINDMFSRLRVSCTNYFFSPQANVVLKVDNGESYKFNFSTDAHFQNLFLDFGILYPLNSDLPKELRSGNEVEDVRRYYRHRLFTESLEEFKTRSLRQSLWKTYEEYNIFISSLAKQYNISEQTIKDELQILIKKGNLIDFEDVIATTKESRPNNGLKKEVNKINAYEHVYTNYPDFPKSYTLLDNEKEFESIFGFLGEGLIIRFYSCKFKDFSQIQIQFENKIYKYGEIVKTLIPEDFSFPYIYYCSGKSLIKNKQEILDTLGKNLMEYILNKNSKKGVNMGNSNFDTGKTIRDSVHGDIFVPNRFLKIVDCKVFQRLHRIKQLGTADMIFPEAVHTRFAHSLGTYHITNLMMNHFCELLETLKINYSQTEKDVILAAALLHDIGHGPYSHAYEHIGGKKKNHEEWSKEIIKKDPELTEVLEKEFGCDFADKVVACLDKQPRTDDNYFLTNIFSEIISSNLDADRMDYLLRDAYNTGVKFGVFDLQKLISNMELVEYGSKPKIALRIDAVPSIEQFMFGRYNMYSEVYYASYKLALEKILAKICERIEDKELYKKKENNSIDKDKALYKLFHNSTDLHTYLQMDDYSFMHEIEKVEEDNNDIILRKLLESLKNRGGYKRMRMRHEDANKFISNWKKVFPDAEKIKYGVLCVGKDFKAYEADDKEILIISNNGVVKKFSEVSRLFDAKKDDKKLWHTLTGYVYFNEEILKYELDELKEKININKAISDLKMLFEKYDLNKHTEIENKYDCSFESIKAAKRVNTIFKNKLLTGFACDGDLVSNEQEDIYFDTNNFLLAKNKYSLRCRKKGEDYIFTIKKPTTTVGENKQAQFIRSEFEEKRQSSDIKEAKDLFEEHLACELQTITGVKTELSEFKPVVRVVNNRTSYLVKDADKNSGFCCEVSLDSIKYKDNAGQEKFDYQVEIELKSKYSYRLRMNKFAENFCEAVGISGESRAKESKYLKALASLNLD